MIVFRALSFLIIREPRDNHNKVVRQDITDLELVTIPGGFNNPLDKGFRYLVMHWTFFTCNGDAVSGCDTRESEKEAFTFLPY
jgi:hypothetical protein